MHKAKDLLFMSANLLYHVVYFLITVEGDNQTRIYCQILIAIEIEAT